MFLIVIIFIYELWFLKNMMEKLENKIVICVKGTEKHLYFNGTISKWREDGFIDFDDDVDGSMMINRDHILWIKEGGK